MSTGMRLRNGKRIRCPGDGEGTIEEDQATLVSPRLFVSVQLIHILARQVETELINTPGSPKW